MCILKIGRKGTAFWGHSQIKCTKSTLLCTKYLFCAIRNSDFFC